MSKSLRDQLIEARADIQHEIDILRTPTTIGGGYFIDPKNPLVATLEAKLQEIDEALAGLGTNEGENSN
jgi:hypothetical protein